jgi:hypothetical protein
MATMANDEVEQDNPGLFASNPIRRIGEWRTAMLADPSHTQKLSKGYAITIAGRFPFREGEEL